MKTKAEYLARAEAAIAEHPNAALAYQVRDPRLLAMLESMATMLAMHSMEQDVAAMEPWTKARDVTVLADAAAKGVLPFCTPTRVSLTVQNVTPTAFDVATGRRLLDQQGRVYTVTVGATVAANGTATVEAVQRTETILSHTVAVRQPFYRIDIPSPGIGYIAGVQMTDDQGNVFRYTPEFTNVEIGERIFHLESDESRSLAVVFGAQSVGGYQPSVGEVMNVVIAVSEGDIALSSGASFVFEYATTVHESGAKISLAAILAPGAAPVDINTLREITSYPSLYDTSAVYLANFDFLIRRTLAPFRFLSVWNEQREEEVRGASLDSMNALFIAARKDGVDDATLRADIERIVMAADNSYRIRWVAVQELEVPVTVVLSVPDVYDRLAIARQAREIILEQYGRDSTWAKRGSGRVLYRRITSLLQSRIEASRAEDADIVVTVADEATLLPETYRYVSTASLSITVENTQ